MSHRRTEDRVLALVDRASRLAQGDEPSQVAMAWLRMLLQHEFSDPWEKLLTPVPSASAQDLLQDPAPVGDTFGTETVGPEPHLMADVHWRREWLRRWRRFKLPDQLASFSEDLARARTADEIYIKLSEYAVRIVDGYTCLVFVSEAGASRPRSLPNPDLGLEPGRFALSPSPLLNCAGLLTRSTMSDLGPFADLDPLFVETRANSIARVPFTRNGVLMLVERRSNRLFGSEEIALLRSLAALAEVSLERLQLLGEIGALSAADPLTGLMEHEHVETVVEHAMAAARRDRALCLVVVELTSPPGVEAPPRVMRDEILRVAADTLRRATRDFGLTLRCGDHSFLLVLPEAGTPEVRALLRRVWDELGTRAEIQVGVAEYRHDVQSAEDLIDRAFAALAALRSHPGLIADSWDSPDHDHPFSKPVHPAG